MVLGVMEGGKLFCHNHTIRGGPMQQGQRSEGDKAYLNYTRIP